jgi:hypothetical protein
VPQLAHSLSPANLSARPRGNEWSFELLVNLLNQQYTDSNNEQEGGDISGTVETAYLKQLIVTHRARARQALRWRPKFLSALGISCSYAFATKAAGIAYNTFRAHQKNDPEFAAQVAEAESEAAELLHSVCFKVAMEGELEPVYFQGEVVGHIKKFDSRMQIELLRAHMPQTFKRPGSVTPIIQGGGNQMLVVDEDLRDALVAMRQKSLQAIAAKKGSLATTT